MFTVTKAMKTITFFLEEQGVTCSLLLTVTGFQNSKRELGGHIPTFNGPGEAVC